MTVLDTVRSAGAALLLICVACSAAAAQREPAAGSADAPRIVAYVTGWTTPPDIRPQQLTHINFAFARIDDGKAVLPHEGMPAQLAHLRALKAQNPRLKVLLSIGGWEAEGFSDAASSAASRAAFAGSAVALMRAHELDGLDLDWEYPGQSVAGIKSRPADKQNFTLLLQTARRLLDEASAAQGRSGAERYLLTIASADREYFEHTQMDRLHVYLDWINVMTYDFFNSLTPTTGHHAGLYPSPLAAPGDRNADAAIEQHLAAGIPPQKLVLGVAFYGRAFGGVDPQHNGRNQRYERFLAAYPYAELVERFIGKQGFVREWDAQAQAPYLWNAATRTFITYDDPQSIAIKAGYARRRGLGGIMFWELSQDHRGELLERIVASLRPPGAAR